MKARLLAVASWWSARRTRRDRGCPGVSVLALTAFGDGGAGVARGGGGCHVAPGDRAAVVGTGATVAAAATFGDGGSRVAHRGGSADVPPCDCASASGHGGCSTLCVEGLLHSPGDPHCAGPGHSGGRAAECEAYYAERRCSSAFLSLRNLRRTVSPSRVGRPHMVAASAQVRAPSQNLAITISSMADKGPSTRLRAGCVGST